MIIVGVVSEYKKIKRVAIYIFKSWYANIYSLNLVIKQRTQSLDWVLVLYLISEKMNKIYD